MEGQKNNLTFLFQVLTYEMKKQKVIFSLYLSIEKPQNAKPRRFSHISSIRRSDVRNLSVR